MASVHRAEWLMKHGARRACLLYQSNNQSSPCVRVCPETAERALDVRISVIRSFLVIDYVC